MNGLDKSLLGLVIVIGLLTGCASQRDQPMAASGSTEKSAETSGSSNPQLTYQLASGVYNCELGQRLEISRDQRKMSHLELTWQRNRYQLQRYDSSSGLPRYEDRQNGLLWIELPWKGMLMDAKSGRPLANECKVTRS